MHVTPGGETRRVFLLMQDFVYRGRIVSVLLLNAS